jgi:hypothetical protein
LLLVCACFKHWWWGWSFQSQLLYLLVLWPWYNQRFKLLLKHFIIKYSTLYRFAIFCYLLWIFQVTLAIVCVLKLTVPCLWPLTSVFQLKYLGLKFCLALCIWNNTVILCSEVWVWVHACVCKFDFQLVTEKILN